MVHNFGQKARVREGDLRLAESPDGVHTGAAVDPAYDSELDYLFYEGWGEGSILGFSPMK